MTGRERSTRGKVGAVFFAFVMVTSMMAVGIGGLAGSAAAGSANDISITTTEPVQPGESTTLQFDIDSNAGNDFLVGIDADSSNTIETDEIVSNTQPGTGDGQTITFTPSDATELDPSADSSFTLAVLQEGDSDGSASSFSTQGAEDAKLTFDVDGVAPSAEAANTEYLDTDSDGQVDEVHLDFNEDISASTLEAGDFSFNDGQASDLSIDSVQANSDEVEISVTGPTGDTDLGDLDVDYTASAGTSDSIVDAAGNPAGDVTDQDVSDGAGPVILSFRQASSTSATIEFSEGVSADDGSDNDLETGDLTYTNGNGAGADSSLTSVTHTAGDSTATVSPTGSITSGDIGADTITAGAAIDDGVDNSPGSTSPVTLETGTLSGDSNNDISTQIGTSQNQDVLAGNASEALNLIRLKDISGGDSPLSQRTILNMPDGVTINESETDLLVTTTSGDLSVTGTEIVDASTLRVDHSGSSVNGQILRISGLSVDVAPNASASQTGVSDPDNDITVDYATGSFDTSLLNVQKAAVDFEPDDNPGTFGAGTTDNTLNDNIRVTAPANLDGGIAGDSDLVISANESNRITFNTDFDPTTLTASGGVPGKVDTSSASLSETQLTIPVTDEFAQGESVTIDTDGSLPVDLAGDAQASQLTASFRTNQSTGQIEAKTAQANQIGVNRPVVDLAADDTPDNGPVDNDKQESIAVGKNSQPVAEEADGGNGLRIETTSDAQITDGSDVIITTNRSDVTFDTSFSVDNDDTTFDDSADALEAVFTNDVSGDNGVSNINIQEDQIVLTVSADTEDGDILAVDEIPLNVASSVEDEERVSFNVTTTPSTNTEVLSTESGSDYIELDRPDISLNGDSNVTVNLDSDGTQTFVDPATGSNGAADGSQDALVIDSDDVGGQIVSGQTVTIALESSTGVTFNQTQSVDLVSGAALAGLDNQAGDGVDDTDTVDIDVSDNTDLSNLQTSQTEISFQVDGNVPANQRIHVDQLYLNASANAQNTTLSVTTNTGDNEVTTVDNKLIKINTVEPSNVFGDANIQEDSADADVGPNLDGTGNGDFGGVNSEEATDDGTTDDRPVVDETITSRVYVEDGGSAFGGATVDLEVVQTPDGSSGASLNTTSVVTEANGVADFGFTVGDTNGVYVVNASTDSGSVNITYDAEPGQVADVNVTPIENAIVGGSNDLDQAALYVNATDANGNPVGANPTVDVTADNVGASEIGAYEDKDPDGSRDDLSAPNAPDDDLTDGSFTIDDTNNDGSSVLEINSDQVEDVTVTVSYQGNSDSGTVTFYDSVGQVDLALNQSTVQVDDTVAAEATISESDGTTIEVPGVTVDYDDNNNGNTTLEGGPDSDSATTNASGVASVNVTPEQNGTSTINVQSNLRSASATLTIGGQPDTGSPLDGTAGEYDSDGDGQVTASELGDASTAFANGELSASELGDVAVAFANS